ncbi:MAG: hypothetical protein R3C01_04510 [Planctomycetaceae bacterium]
MNRFRLIMLAAVIAMPRPMLAELPQDDAKPSPFDTVMQRAAQAAASSEWTKDGWADMQLESALSVLMADLQQITKNENIKLPTTFDSVRPAISRDGSNIAHLKKGLFVTKRGKVSHAHNSIILADESIDISHARNCLIIARGAVDVGHGGGNVIIAGHFIHSSHDGQPDPRDPEGAGGSVLLSGSNVDVSHANDTITCAPLAATMSFATNCIFINTPNRNISHERDSTYLTDKSRRLPTVLPKPQLIDKLIITKIVPPDDAGNGAQVATKQAGVETIIRIGDAVPSATAELEGWELVFIGDGFALFAKDGQYASAYMDPPK